MVLFMGGGGGDKKEGGFPQSILIFIISIFSSNPRFSNVLMFSSIALHYETLNQKPRGTHVSV